MSVGNIKFENYPIELKVGDMVAATEIIRRHDGKCSLMKTQIAKICSVGRTSPSDPQIVAVKLPNGMQMINIVCWKTGPLKLVKSCSCTAV